MWNLALTGFSAALVVGCHAREQATAPPGPPPLVGPQPLAPSASAPAQSSATPIGEPPRVTEGNRLGASTFALRLRLESTDAPTCIGGLYDLSVLGSGEAWIAGDCVRGRIVGSRFDDWAVPTQRATGCATSYGAIQAVSATQGYARATRYCGNKTVDHRLEKFDGTTWTAVGPSPDKAMGGGLVAGSDGVLYTLFQGWGKDGQRIEKCAIHRLEKHGFGKPLTECRGKPKTQRFELFSDLAVASDGKVYVVGSRYSAPGAPPTAVADDESLVWSFVGGKWSEAPIADVTPQLVSAAPDGSVFIAGNDLWRLKTGTWEKVATRPFDRDIVISMWARSSDDVWFTTHGKVLRWNGGKLATLPVAIASKGCEGFRRIRGSGEHVFLLSGMCVWSLTPPAERVSNPPVLRAGAN